jgi:hypothetical protein
MSLEFYFCKCSNVLVELLSSGDDDVETGKKDKAKPDAAKATPKRGKPPGWNLRMVNKNI